MTVKRRTLAEILTRARAGLLTNPTITVYEMIGGYEHRRLANPFAGITAAANRMADQIASLTLGFKDFGKALDKAMGPVRGER